MPGTTPILKLPYPLGTDFVVDGDDAIHNLGTGIEATFRFGNAVVTTNVNGDGLITFSPAFTTQILGAVAVDGGNPSTGPGAYFIKTNLAASTRTGLAVRVYSAATAPPAILPSYPVQVCFIAIGY